ncbi:helix-turn-helix domain-containing protein [Aquibacillus salsiterrae]|uniref:Helix-turn-helix domain-containing protein n=1 Tax=Aquibacillus salsiterrae TaxID=2950439 RepID=A0A9X3WDE9_9BACI|nr:helix-turn-helix domain-containing protein [Aquibacillus salsiterrae]MDC3416673.1 helix-turn-helix domain-containing protein [Aquibacillus salsiterrae]
MDFVTLHQCFKEESVDDPIIIEFLHNWLPKKVKYLANEVAVEMNTKLRNDDFEAITGKLIILIVEKIEEVEPGVPFRSWICQSTKWVTKNFIRKKKAILIDTSENNNSISNFCTEEELDDFMNEEHSLDSTMLIQFALEDFNMTIDQLSDKTRINIQTLKKIINGKMMPWKLTIEEVAQILHTLNISIDEFIKGLKNKTIIINSKDVNIDGIQLPRAKNMNKREQKKAMIDMEKQIMVQDEAEERDEFIQTLKNFVNR